MHWGISRALVSSTGLLVLQGLAERESGAQADGESNKDPGRVRKTWLTSLLMIVHPQEDSVSLELSDMAPPAGKNNGAHCKKRIGNYFFCTRGTFEYSNAKCIILHKPTVHWYYIAIGEFTTTVHRHCSRMHECIALKKHYSPYGAFSAITFDHIWLHVNYN